MAPDERDRTFDKALARHLRAAGSLRNSTDSSSRGSARAGECPGPETLAAYHERSLLPEEMNSWKEHIVGCASCQTVLSHLEATDEIPLQVANPEKVLARQESTTSQMSVSSKGQPATSVAPRMRVRRALLLHGARWQWLAPAGALAAGLLVWIALHENKPLPLRSMQQVEIATKQAPPPPAPSVSAAVREAPPQPKTVLTNPQSRGGDYAVNGRVASEPEKKSEILAPATAAPSSKLLTDKERSEVEGRKDRARDASADELMAANRADLDARNVPETLHKKEDAQLQGAKGQIPAAAQEQNAQAQNQYDDARQKAPGPSPLKQAENSKKFKAAATPAPPPKSVAAGGAAGFNSSLEAARAIMNPRLVSPPGGNIIWRVGRSGSIEFSKDRGSSWSRQDSGVVADLLSGSAPSDQVCWIVGRAGTVLLTSDGGMHWTKIASPSSDDLDGVRASDDSHATVWSRQSGKNFATGDGGRTWSRTDGQ